MSIFQKVFRPKCPLKKWTPFILCCWRRRNEYLGYDIFWIQTYPNSWNHFPQAIELRSLDDNAVHFVYDPGHKRALDWHQKNNFPTETQRSEILRMTGMCHWEQSRVGFLHISKAETITDATIYLFHRVGKTPKEKVLAVIKHELLHAVGMTHTNIGTVFKSICRTGCS